MNQSLFLKRLFDICFSAAVLVFGAPFFLIIAIAVKSTSKGPVLFKQIRNGLNGEEFEILKFRTMVVHQEDTDRVTQATRTDPRITKVGKFLRRTSLDELPQFVNTLKGEMSVVGPRPHAAAHNLEFATKIPNYNRRHEVKPGISGLAQINGHRGETETTEKMEHRVLDDIKYVDTWTVLGDIKIVFITIFMGFTGNNAF